jgi:transcriptional regulator with XRE-family HTH domain
MESSRETLNRAVESARKSRLIKGTTITNEEIASKLNISEQQLLAYLNGEDDTPADLTHKLYEAYNIGIHMVMSTYTEDIGKPKPRQNQSTNKSKSTTLQNVIFLIKSLAKENGMSVSEENMADRIGFPAQQLSACLNNKKKSPHDLASRLLDAYEDLFLANRMKDNRAFLERTIVVIRNRGLAAGKDITAEEMAGKIGMSQEQVYAYLKGEYDTPEDLSATLTAAYKTLAKYTGQVKIKENIHMIMSPKK